MSYSPSHFFMYCSMVSFHHGYFFCFIESGPQLLPPQRGSKSKKGEGGGELSIRTPLIRVCYLLLLLDILLVQDHNTTRKIVKMLMNFKLLSSH